MRPLLFLPALLIGCATTALPAPVVTPARAPIPILTEERVNALIGEVATLRGLPPRAPVPIYLLEDRAFVLALRGRIGDPLQSGELEKEEAFIHQFHLVPNPAGRGRISSTREVLEEQVAAFYDREHHYVVARKSQPLTKQDAEKQLSTLAHEIEHALQDQYFAHVDMQKMSGMDEVLAYRAVLEGDAMMAMLAFQAADHGIPFSRAIRRLSDVARNVPIEQFVQSERGTALDSALPLMRERLLFPYHAGAGLVADIYRAGGLSLVNQLFTKRPQSTEQVLHPEKYIAGDQPVPIRLPHLPAGYEAISTDTLGELQIRVVLSPCSTPEIAKKAAEGWGGDRYTLIKGVENTRALLWSTTWDTDADAAEFVHVLNGNPLCLGGGLVISTEGKNVAVTRGLAETIAKPTTNTLLASVEDKPIAVPIGNYVIPRTLPPPAEKGGILGQTYVSRWLGVQGLVPYGFSGRIGNGATELRIGLPGFGTTGTLIISDKMTTPRFVEEVFQQLAQELRDFSDGQPLTPVAGGPVSLQLGVAVDRVWFVKHRDVMIRAVILPVCNGTGSYIFLQLWPARSGNMMLDVWMNSFQWTSPGTPPICGFLNPP